MACTKHKEGALNKAGGHCQETYFGIDMATGHSGTGSNVLNRHSHGVVGARGPFPRFLSPSLGELGQSRGTYSGIDVELNIIFRQYH